MAQHTITEDDLRAALLTCAPGDLDVTDFRARLDRVLGDAGSVTSTEAEEVRHEPEAVVIPLTTSARTRRSTRSSVWLVATAAACVAAIVALVVALLPGSADHQNATYGVPKDIRAELLPGTIVVGTYRGTGNRDIAIPPETVPEYFTYGFYSTCTGGGQLFVMSVGSNDGCDSGHGVYGGTGTPTNGAVPVRAGERGSWVVTVVIEPEPRTNGSVQSPPGEPAGPDNGLRQSGRGSRTVTFAGDPASAGAKGMQYTVRLTCNGAGVQLPDLNGTGTAGGPAITGGLVTHTCFAGHEYVWQYVTLTLPRQVRVVASAGTTWRIVLD